jgi:YfiH family protein
MVTLLQSEKLASIDTLMHAFTTRHGGSSPQPYLSNNMAFHVGDDPHYVEKNHAALAEMLGYDKAALVFMRQIHSDRVVRITDESFATPPEADAIITNVLNKPLMVMVADCTPLLLYDPEHHAIAAVHAGRAGAFQNIIAKTVHAMQQAFGTQPSALIVVMGPSICGRCYEVNAAISNEALALGYEAAIQTNVQRYFLDVNHILMRQLVSLGIKQEQIDAMPHCTLCDHKTFFSYRSEQKTGRNSAVIMLK